MKGVKGDAVVIMAEKTPGAGIAALIFIRPTCKEGFGPYAPGFDSCRMRI